MTHRAQPAIEVAHFAGVDSDAAIAQVGELARGEGEGGAAVFSPSRSKCEMPALGPRAFRVKLTNRKEQIPGLRCGHYAAPYYRVRDLLRSLPDIGKNGFARCIDPAKPSCSCCNMRKAVVE